MCAGGVEGYKELYSSLCFACKLFDYLFAFVSVSLQSDALKSSLHVAKQELSEMSCFWVEQT